jgi:hypothetical protein
MHVRNATLDDIVHVCGRLRPEDAEEQFARRGDDSAAALAADLIGLSRLAIGRFAFLTPDGEPQTILAAYRASPAGARPRLAKLHRISTTRWDDVSRAVFLFGLRTFVPGVLVPFVDRAECAVLAKHQPAAAMLARLGFVAEGIDAMRGKRGEEFMNFGWTNPEA